METSLNFRSILNLWLTLYSFLNLHMWPDDGPEMRVETCQLKWNKNTNNTSCLSQYLTKLIHKICFTISFYFMPLHVSSTCAHHQEVIIVLYRIWYHHTETSEWSKMCDDTTGFVMQFWPPDDEQVCSKHVETWNKTYCETNFVHQVG